MLCGLISLLILLIPGLLNAQPKEPPVLQLGVGDNTPPLYWKSNKDATDVQGFVVDTMREVARQAGLKLQVKAYPLPRLQRLVEQGNLDAMVINVTPKRLEFAVSSQEFLLKDRVSIFIHKDSPVLDSVRKVKTLDELASTKTTVNGLLGSSWHSTNLESRGINVFYSDGTVSTVKMLIKKRGDIVVDMALNIRWILAHEPGGENILELPDPISTVSWHLMISKQSPFVKNLKSLDEAIVKVKASPEFKAILKKYSIQPNLLPSN